MKALSSESSADLTYDEALAFVSGRVGFGQRVNRDRLIALLHRLGNPHKRLRCVHVAGTNGKGSTSTFIASVLKAAGYRTGAYFSPYVFDVRERFQINGELISPETFARHVTTLRPHVLALAETDLGQTTEFEVKTAIAFLHFAEEATDFAVIEVGIGGRLDATNVIPPPLVAVIVSIGWDHMNLLGDTLGKIAFEKAGIFKPGTIGVTAVPPGEARTVIETVARERHIPLYTVAPRQSPPAAEALVQYERAHDGRLSLWLSDGPLHDLHLTLRAAYQAENAATAAAAIEVLRQHRGIAISDAALRTGLETASLPGRFQIFRPSGSDGPVLLLDGAHNEDGARTLRDALDAEFGTDQRYTFVIGMSKNHEPLPYLRVLAPVMERLIATQPPFKPRPVQDIVQGAKLLGVPVSVVPMAREAILYAFANAVAGEIVVVTGSFYTVGETPKSLRPD